MPTVRARPLRPGSGGVPWFALALLACAVLVLLGSLAHRHELTFAAAALLLVAWAPRVWRRHRVAAWLAWSMLAVALLIPAGLGRPGLALMVLPVAFPAWVAWLFARTLRRGAEPLVARFIRVIEGEARIAVPRVRGYARGVTVYWVCVLGALAALSLAVALVARPGGWLDAFGVDIALGVPGAWLAWYPEAGCWALLVAAFAAEYLFRRAYLRGVPQLGVGSFVVRMVRNWPELVRGVDAQ